MAKSPEGLMEQVWERLTRHGIDYFVLGKFPLMHKSGICMHNDVLPISSRVHG